MSLKISKFFAIPLIFSSFLFDTNNELNKINANVKNSPANKNEKIRGIARILDIFKPIFDLFLIHIVKDNIF